MIDVALYSSEICRISASGLSGVTAIVFGVLRAISSIMTGPQVLIGAFFNMDTLTDHLFRTRPRKLLLICAGTGEDFTLEDALEGGTLLAHLPDDDLSDSAILVRNIYERNDLEEWLTSNGRRLQKMGRGAGVHRCVRLSIFNVVGQLRGKAIVPLEP